MFKNTALTLATFLFILLAANYLLGEVAVYYEMWTTGTTVRAELSEDYGLGMLGLLVIFPVSVFVALVSGWLTWRRLTRCESEGDGNA